MDDNSIFAQIAKELAAGIKDDALWLKAFSSENGDEAKSKAHYVRLRAEQLKNIKPTAIPRHAASTTSPPSRDSTNRWKILLLIGFAIAITATLANREPAPPTSPIKQETAPLPQKVEPDLITYEEMRRAGVTVNGETGTIGIDGEITSATANQFDFALKLMPAVGPITVFLNSPGGDLYGAMAIGRAIRKTNQTVVVAVMENAKCYSACVFILAAGKQRIRLGSIGIHRPYSASPSSDQRQAEHWYAKISNDAKSYLREMRVREALFDDMVNIEPSSLLIFRSTTEMDRYGLIKTDPVVEEQIASKLMTKYGITDRSVLMQRQANAQRACSDDFQFEGRKYTLQECFDAFLTGHLALQ